MCVWNTMHADLDTKTPLVCRKGTKKDKYAEMIPSKGAVCKINMAKLFFLNNIYYFCNVFDV